MCMIVHCAGVRNEIQRAGKEGPGKAAEAERKKAAAAAKERADLERFISQQMAQVRWGEGRGEGMGEERKEGKVERR